MEPAGVPAAYPGAGGFKYNSGMKDRELFSGFPAIKQFVEEELPASLAQQAKLPLSEVPRPSGEPPAEMVRLFEQALKHGRK